MKKEKQRKIIYGITLILAIVIAFTGVFLPGWLFAAQNNREFGTVASAPEEYYSAAYSAMARNESAGLAVLNKLQLITGKWSSVLMEPKDFEIDRQDYEVAELARDGIDSLYQAGIYPTGLEGYGNWYSWQVTAHKAVDTTFHTYSAYYWEVAFQKYDGKERHRVYLLDDGTVFLAVADYEEPFEYGSRRNAEEISHKSDISISESEAGAAPKEQIHFTDMDLTDFSWVDYVKIQKDEEIYYVAQAESACGYLYALLP